MENVRQIATKELRPNPWGIKVGPPLSQEDDAQLRSSIAMSGIQIPLIVWRSGSRLVVLSGGNRLRIARELGLPKVPCIVRKFGSRNEAHLFALSDNLSRRHLSTGQRAYLAFYYQKIMRVGRGKCTDLPSTNLSKVDSRKAAAEKASVSEGSLEAMKMLVESGVQELLDSLCYMAPRPYTPPCTPCVPRPTVTPPIPTTTTTRHERKPRH